MSKITVTKNGPFVSIKVDGEGILNLNREEAEGLIELIKVRLEGSPDKNKRIVKLRVPVKYFSETVKEEDKKVFEMYKALAADIADKGCGVIVFPAVRDDMGNPLFDIEVL